MEKLRIVVSGVNDDMQLELDCVSRAVASVEVAEGIRVEHALANKESTRDWILEQVQACDVYVGVFNHRYGWIVPNGDVSTAEFEFNRARELQKPILAWIRKPRDEEMRLPDFNRQEDFLKQARDSSRYKRKESGDPSDLEDWTASVLRAAYLNSRLRAGLSFDEVLGERLFNDHWAEVIVMLAGINDRPAKLVEWLSRQVQRKNDWQRVLLVRRCWKASAASDEAEAQAAVIDALLVGLATAVSNEKGVAYRGIDPHVRRLSIRALASIGEPAVERLIASLREGLGVGAGAADALGMIGDAGAVEPLIEALAYREDTRQSAAAALGRIGDARASKPLFATLSDEDEDVCWSAASALGEIGDRSVVAPLIELLEGQGEEFSWPIDSESDEVGLAEFLRTAPAAATLIGNPLALGSDALKWLSAYALGKIGDERAVDPLIAKLKYRRDEDVRRRAAEALGEIGDERAVDPLINALRDSEAGVRWNAAQALGKIGSRRALRELQRVAREDHALSESESEEVADAAQKAIRKLKKRSTPKNVRRLIEDSPVTTLYKYFPPNLIRVLKNGCIRFTQASRFNDPFELFPTMDSYLRPLMMVVTLERWKSAHYARMVAGFEELLGERAYNLGFPAMVKDSLQDDDSDEVQAMRQELECAITNLTSEARGALISKAKEDINERFGILCLAEKADNILMWSHYADSHKGFVVEFDAANSFFDRRTFDNDPIRRIRKVQYQTGRPAGTLFDRKYWLRSKATASEDLLEYTAGLFLLTKSCDWAYEQEWRLIVPLSHADKVIPDPNGDIYLFSLPASCIRAVILGPKISDLDRQTICEALSSPEYSHVEVRKAQMDSHQFRVVIKDDESVLEKKLLKDIVAFPNAGIQERLKRLEVSGPRLYSAISSLSAKDLISSSSYDRSKQKKRTLGLTDAGRTFLKARVSR